MTTEIWAQDRRQLVLDGEGVEVEMVEGEKRQRVLYTYVHGHVQNRGGREWKKGNSFSRDIWEGFFVENLVKYFWRILRNLWRRFGRMDILGNIPED